MEELEKTVRFPYAFPPPASSPRRETSSFASQMRDLDRKHEEEKQALNSNYELRLQNIGSTLKDTLYKLANDKVSNTFVVLLLYLLAGGVSGATNPWLFNDAVGW